MNDDLDPNPHDDPTSPRPLPRNDSVRFTLNEAYAPTPAPPIQQLPSSLGTHTSTSSTSLKDVSQSSEDVSDASQTIREASKLPPDKQLQDGEDTYRMRHGWDSQYSAEQLQELSKVSWSLPSDTALFLSDQSLELLPILQRQAS